MTEALAELERIVGCTQSTPRNKCVCGNMFQFTRVAKSKRYGVENFVLPDEKKAKLGWCRNCGHFLVVYASKPFDVVRDLTKDEAVRLRMVGWEQVRGYVDPIVEWMIG